MIKIQYWTGSRWVDAGEFTNERIAWMSLGGDDDNYRTIDINGNVLTDKSDPDYKADQYARDAAMDNLTDRIPPDDA